MRTYTDSASPAAPTSAGEASQNNKLAAARRGTGTSTGPHCESPLCVSPLACRHCACPHWRGEPQAYNETSFQPSLSEKVIHVIGGGLAGTEAAHQVAAHGRRVRLYEMRPQSRTPAHQTDRLAELVCSNSLKSETAQSAPWLLKEELRRMGSLLMRAAQQARVPGGNALTVDRDRFSGQIEQAIEREPLIELRREEVRELPLDETVIVASGPSDQRRAGRLDRKGHGQRAAVLPRRHQPDRRCRDD